MKFEPGMRVRCVTANTPEIFVVKEQRGRLLSLRGFRGWFLAAAFKPVVRVKMGRRVA